MSELVSDRETLHIASSNRKRGDEWPSVVLERDGDARNIAARLVVMVGLEVGYDSDPQPL